MKSEDLEFMSTGFIEVNKQLGRSVSYVPYDAVNSTRDKFGTEKFVWIETSPITLHVSFSKDSTVNTDLAVFWTGRINANITLVGKELRDNNIQLKEKDAFDIVIDGETKRFLITGFPKDPKLFEVFTKVLVTDIDHAFKGGV